MSQNYTLEPGYIDGALGSLFTMHYRPNKLTEDTECFVVAPSFAEEMNRCRYMCTMLAQSLAENHYAYLSIDPFGTGDSEGDFIDADWQQACADIITAVGYAKKLGYKKISLLGIRLGALQVMQIVSSIPSLTRIVFWQPVVSGKTTLVQFLRIKIAASIGRNEKPGTIDEFDAQVAQGDSIEVAGYDVSPGLYQGIKSANLKDHLDFTSVPIAWFTTLNSVERKTPRAELDVMDKWKQAGAHIDHNIVIGPSYWQVHERTLVPELVTATVNYILDNKL